MAHDQPLLAVQEALKKCFLMVEKQQDLWQSTLQDFSPLLSSLSNLAEQLQAAQSLRFEDVPALRPFPDLQERLRRKQLEAGDVVLDKLAERQAALLKVRDTISSHVEQVFHTYEQHAAVLDMDSVLQPSVVSPSVADMLEWLQDIDRHYRSSYPSSASRPPRASPRSLCRFRFHKSLTSGKVPEEKVPPLLHTLGRLGQHPITAQGLGPNFRRRVPNPCARYPGECLFLPGGARGLCSV
ncbi:ribosome biogenesis protein C1orf109 homolog isoform X2 [Psammomys obesus]|nr:ribosome biogenesis protein C1orf109 homolog isoform X2 [Psammomys obesus]XP_055467395.1 ribosome biogenesis protein C1orf109 homolog isoform X2 [Psammomys obesus]